MTIKPFDGYMAGRDELRRAGWYVEAEGDLGGSAKFHWERFVSPDGELMATFYTGWSTAEVCRNV